MDPLSTANLEYLLSISTPEPWHFHEDIVDTLSGTQDIIHEVCTPTEPELFFASGDITDTHPGNLQLAALAPQLAREVIALRAELAKQQEQHSDKTYTLYWRTGTQQTITGTDIAAAMNNAGIGRGALSALDFYDEGEPDPNYHWDADAQEWTKESE